MNVLVRPAEVKDAEAIARVHVKTWQCAYKRIMSDKLLDSLSVEKRTKAWEEILSKLESDSRTFVAEIVGKVIGFCSIGSCRDENMDQTFGELWALYVDPDSINKGAGSALQKKGLSYLKEKGYKKATLWVLTSNKSAREWYESKGWKLEGKTKIEDRDGFELHETRYIIYL